MAEGGHSGTLSCPILYYGPTRSLYLAVSRAARAGAAELAQTADLQ